MHKKEAKNTVMPYPFKRASLNIKTKNENK